ncbi:hypothetical protein ABLL37_003689 [Shigella boydii]|nr:hypothetical protein [Shigella boydii]
MRGNSHAPFLGGGGAAMCRCYPTRQGGDSFAGSVHDSQPRQGDARESHKQERRGEERKEEEEEEQ